MRKTGQNGLDLIRHVEGTVLTVYLDSRGLPTVGTGHLIRIADNLRPGDQITSERSRQFLQDDLSLAEACVNRHCPDLTQNQFDALVSFVFNEGCGAFSGSTLMHLVNAGDVQGAADQFQLWVRAGQTRPRGLRVRRALERDLFLAPDGVPLDPSWLRAHDSIS